MDTSVQTPTIDTEALWGTYSDWLSTGFTGYKLQQSQYALQAAAGGISKESETWKASMGAIEAEWQQNLAGIRGSETAKSLDEAFMQDVYGYHIAKESLVTGMKQGLFSFEGYKADYYKKAQTQQFENDSVVGQEPPALKTEAELKEEYQILEAKTKYTLDYIDKFTAAMQGRAEAAKQFEETLGYTPSVAESYFAARYGVPGFKGDVPKDVASAERAAGLKAGQRKAVGGNQPTVSPWMTEDEETQKSPWM